MTSKISYFKFIEADIRHRGWLAALSAVLMFLLLPVYTMISIDSMITSGPYADNAGDAKRWMEGSFPGMLNGAFHRPFAVFIAVLAILCAVTGFAYLHTREKQDFYHGMPVKRTQWFRISYIGGLLIFIVPYLLFSLCTILLCQTKGYMDSGLLLSSLTAILGGILGFLICYHTSILAMFLTGRIVTGVLAALVLFVYGTIITSLYEGLASNFFDTWSSGLQNITAKSWNFSSPLTLFIRTLSTTAYRWEWGLVVCAVLCAVLPVVLALLAYKYYPAEAAENALAFPKSAPVIKILIAVPTALFIGLFVSSFRANLGRNWIIFNSIIAVLLLCLVIEFIYHQDLRQLLAGKISSAVSVGMVLCIICMLKFDLFGFDSYLPKEEKLANMTVYANQFFGFFSYPENLSSISYDQLTAPNASITDYGPLYQLAEEGIANAKKGITPLFIDNAASPSDYVNITLRYGLTRGKDIYRAYAVDRTVLLGVMEQLCQNVNYRKELFPIFHLDRKEIHKINIQDIYYQETPLSLSKEQNNQLLDAYEKDILEVDIAVLQYEEPMGELTLELPDENAAEPINGLPKSTSWLGQFYIYSSYHNTLDILKQFGYTLRTEINPEDVVMMTYYPNEGNSDFTTNAYDQKAMADYSFGDGIPITEPEEIQSILKKITFDAGSRLLGNAQESTGSVEITVKGKAYPNSYVLHE